MEEPESRANLAETDLMGMQKKDEFCKDITILRIKYPLEPAGKNRSRLLPNIYP